MKKPQIPLYVKQYLGYFQQSENIQDKKSLTKSQLKAKKWLLNNQLKMYIYEWLNNDYANKEFITKLKEKINLLTINNNYIIYNNMKIKVVKDINNNLQILSIEKNE